MIAPWFLAGAPSFLKRPHAAIRAAFSPHPTLDFTIGAPGSEVIFSSE